MLALLMDDHSNALTFWRKHNLEGLTCVHVDAHLDVQDDGFSPSVLERWKGFQTSEDWQEARGNPSLPWGGLHCGNYLYPALVWGTVTHLIWVIPPHMGSRDRLDWLKGEMVGWVDLDFAEYKSLNLQQGRIEGQLAGRRFTVCTAENLPPLNSPVALDFDVDYLITDEDQLWGTTQQFRDSFGEQSIQVLTVATSLEGGYTPPQFEYLGRETMQTFGVEHYDFAPGPGWQTSDQASRYLQQKRHQLGLDVLKSASEDDDSSLFVASLCLQGLGRWDEARASLQCLCSREELLDGERSKVLSILAEVQEQLGQHSRAVELYQESLRLSPLQPKVYLRLAMALKQLGKREEASRQLRKGIRLAKNRLTSLEMNLELARLYAELGQAALAQATHRWIQANDPNGQTAVRSLLETASMF